MAARPHGIHNNQSAANYINKKGINELFEAIMTALMIHKPDDHIAFIRECLDKVQNNPNRVRWDLFVTNTSNTRSALSSRSSVNKNRQKALPPVRTSNLMSKPNQSAIKSTALPPIDNNKKQNSQNIPIIFILSSTSATKLCSRLMERYNEIIYLYINDIANIDEDEDINLNKYEHRYDSIQHAIEQHRSNTHGFLIAGHLDEKNFYKKWQEKLGRIDLIILLSSDQQIKLNQNSHIVQINSNNEFDTILADVIHMVDKIFPHHTFINENSQSKATNFNVPIIFCIDNHQLAIKENNENLLIDEEFDTENDEDGNNSFIFTLCQRLGEQLSFKHIHYGDFNKTLLNFDQLKTSVVESMGTCAGYIIDHFPTSFDDLEKFQTEIGPCSILIYIGEHQTQTKIDELNDIIEKFKIKNKAIYIDCRMEVDEIYEDLKKDILKHI